MRQTPKRAGEKIVKDIKRAPRKHYSSEEKIREITESIRQSVHIYNCEMKHLFAQLNPCRNFDGNKNGTA
jgi:hypothetical protein